MLPSSLSLPAMDRRVRLARLRDIAFNQAHRPDDIGVEALLLTDAVSLRYLTGFTGTAGRLVLDHDRALFMTDGRYRTQLASQLDEAEVADIIETEIGNLDEQQVALTKWLAAVPVGGTSAASAAYGLGVEAESLAWADVIALKAALQRNPTSSPRSPANGPRNPASSPRNPTSGGTTREVQVVATHDVVAKLRIRKDEGEVARITAAAAIADEALAELREMLTKQPTEIEFARTLDHRMLSHGAEALSFATICASGPNSALPHARPTSRRIERGDLVVLDSVRNSTATTPT